MSFLYHQVPANFQGEYLYPLNQLKDIYPQIYAEQKAKYGGREAVMDQDVPHLGKWNDVIHLSPVDPQKVKAVLEEIGFPSAKTPLSFFQIAPTLLDPADTIIYNNKAELKEAKVPENFSLYSVEAVTSLNVVPEATIVYYRKCFLEKREPLIHGYIPHVLYKGKIHIKDIKIITV